MIATASALVVAMLLLSASQLLQKLGAVRHLAHALSFRDAVGALLSTEIVGAVLCLFGGMIAWLVVLYRTDVSRAFPILSFGSILVLVASRFFLKEPVSRRRWVGALLIAFGVALVSAS